MKAMGLCSGLGCSTVPLQSVSQISSHRAEKVPRHVFGICKWSYSQSADLNHRPSINLPKAIHLRIRSPPLSILSQYFTAFLILPTFDLLPLIESYHQVAGSLGGSSGLLVFAFIPSSHCCAWLLPHCQPCFPDISPGKRNCIQ